MPKASGCPVLKTGAFQTCQPYSLSHLSLEIYYDGSVMSTFDAAKKLKVTEVILQRRSK